jgi:hypothetical protein
MSLPVNIYVIRLPSPVTKGQIGIGFAVGLGVRKLRSVCGLTLGAEAILNVSLTRLVLGFEI